MAAACSDEFTLLLAGEKPLGDFQDLDIEVKPLQYRDIPRAVDGDFKAFANNSMQRYLIDAEDFRLHHVRKWIDSVVRFTDAVKRGKIITVDRGDANLLYGVPGNNTEKPPFSWIVSLVGALGSRELRKVRHGQGDCYASVSSCTRKITLEQRRKEIITKSQALLEAAIGERVDELFEVQRLATVPAKQGRGYATALISVVHDLADAQGRATYVFTGDTWKFYESVGYKLVGEDWFGNDNPKYHGPPGPIRLMLREPQPLK
ncbi:hypothetical protein K466DRAFT_174404 [Polyporus arcularius HHB13444]|uniref:N-acetyltransferase domain-containing protein n=1 Tax=Polyporus arcularius HHB13444 TaxID=1314778 RepID=A0A5C3PA95_9APHY|nr:hypothetical protein K466DRAFT_174404 [Polyporus arcularius HHB13444]